ERAAVQPLVQVLDAGGVFAHQHRLEILHRAHHGPGLPLQRCLAPAEQPRLVGLHLHEHPVPHLGIHHHRSDIRDLHLTHAPLPHSPPPPLCPPSPSHTFPPSPPLPFPPLSPSPPPPPP